MNSDDVIKRPVIVIGAPRSGTSILGRLLSQSPGVAYANEPRLIWRYGNDSRSDILPTSSVTPAIREYIRNGFKKYVVRHSGHRLVEKSPANSLRIEFVNEIFPDALFVHVVRNGYESVDSIARYWDSHTQGASQRRIGSNQSILVERLREAHWTQVPHYALELVRRINPIRSVGKRQLWGPRLPGLDQWVRDMPVKEVAALQWRFCVEMACSIGRQMPQDKYMEIRLESIDISSLQAIYDFCGLDWSDDCETYFNDEFDNNVSGGATGAAANFDTDVKIGSLIQPTIDYYHL